MDRSGGTHPITWPRKFGSDNLFYLLFHQKTVQKILDPSHLAILIVPPHHGSSRRPGTAPNSVNMGPKAPIIAYVVALHHPRAQWPPIDAVMVRTEYYCDRNTRFVNFYRKILVASFFIMARERLNGAPGGRTYEPTTALRAPKFGYIAQLYVLDDCVTQGIDQTIS